MREFEYDKLCKATKNFSLSQIIGKGSHGCIYKGLLEEDNQLVAIKRPSIGLQHLQDDSKLNNEASILSSLPTTQNIVNLLGTSTQLDLSRNIRHAQMLVMEFIPNGSLHDMLHSSNNININNKHSLEFSSWEKRAQIALQIAKAMQFLHTLTPKIIHRDIKSTNILLDKNMSPKLIDFGLAIRLTDGINLVLPAGTIGYLDPWYTTPCKVSTKNDVYSFGVLLLEMVTGQKVIDPKRSSTFLVEWCIPLIKNRKFDQIFDSKIVISSLMEERVLMKLVDVAVRSVSSNVDDRPTSDEIVREIENSFYYNVERVRFPIWVRFVRSFIVLKRRANYSKKKCGNNVSSVKCAVCHQRSAFQRSNEVSVRKLLRDHLDDE